MRHLNYNHLHYFWVVAESGSIARAAESLHVTPQTISGQLRTLERRLGSALFRRVGRKCELTETGQMVHSYVDPMFSLGWQLGEVLQKRAPRRPAPLTIGVAAGVGKLIASRVLSPALTASAGARVICREAPSESLASALLSHDVDLALTDGILSSPHSARLRSHLVGQSGVTFLCAAHAAERYRARFPAGLNGAPFVMPARTSALAKSLTDWLRLQRVSVAVVAEIESPDLAAALCEAHSALLAVPTSVAHEAERRYRLAAVAAAPSIEQHFYLASAARPNPHASIASIIDAARRELRPPAAGAELERVVDSLRALRDVAPMATAAGPHPEECAI